jgi:hypothetical protein
MSTYLEICRRRLAYCRCGGGGRGAGHAQCLRGARRGSRLRLRAPGDRVVRAPWDDGAGLPQLGTMAASLHARLSKSAFVAGALQELSCALCKGNGRMYQASTFSLARAAGQQIVPGRDVPVAEVGEV